MMPVKPTSAVESGRFAVPSRRRGSRLQACGQVAARQSADSKSPKAQEKLWSRYDQLRGEADITLLTCQALLGQDFSDHHHEE